MKIERRTIIDETISKFIGFLKIALPKLQIQAISLRVFDPEYNNLLLFGKTGFNYPEKRRAVVPVKNTVAGHLYEEGGLKFVSLDDEDWFNRGDQKLAKKECYQYMMAGSLEWLGQRIGTVQVYTKNNFNVYSEEKLKHVMNMLVSLSTPFLRGYLEDEFLSVIQQELSSTNPLGGFFHMCRLISELFSTNAVVVYEMVNNHVDKVRLIAGYQEEEKVEPHGIDQKFSINGEIEKSLTYLKEVKEKKKSMIFKGFDKRLKCIHGIMHEHGTKSLLVSPIIIDDFVQGFIVVNQSEKRGPFNENEVGLIERIALKASQALATIKLQNELANCRISDFTSDLIAKIRHALKNSLVAIGGNAKNLSKKENLPEEMHEGLEVICEESKRLEEALNLINEFCVNGEKIEKSYINLISFLKKTVKRWQLRVKKDGYKINFLSDKDSLHIYGNEVILGDALDNLIINALQAMEKGQELKIIFEDSSEVEFVITLKNPGIIKEEVLPRIFDPTFTTKKDGNGLGLPLAQRDLALHGADIDCKCHGGYTIFTIHWPKKEVEL